MAGIPPTDSALGRALGVRQAGEWTTTEDLLALLVEVLDLGNRYFVSAHTKKGASKPKPIVVPRPDPPRRKGDPVEEEARPGKRPATSEELVAFFGGTARYTGPPKADQGARERPRCELGHYVRPGVPCRRCADNGPADA